MKLNLKRDARSEPRKPRVATTIVSAVLLPDDREITILIRNMSPGGFMAITEQPLELDTWLGVAIPGRGIRKAQVRWYESGMLGAQFETPLGLEEVEEF